MRLIIAFTLCLLSLLNVAEATLPLKVGVGRREITPPLGIPSAGCFGRDNNGMKEVHDPLLAKAMVIDNGEQLIAFCSVDSFGFSREMNVEIVQRVQKNEGLSHCRIFIGSSHTHSGGGAFVNMAEIGEWIAGTYDARITESYIQDVVNAIVDAYQNLQLAKVGIGYGKIEGFTTYTGPTPLELGYPSDLYLIKVTTLEDIPLVAFFSCSIIPNVLIKEGTGIGPNEKEMFSFSADLICYVRNYLQALIGSGVDAIFFNGPTAELQTLIPILNDRFESCNQIGQILAENVFDLWNKIKTDDSIQVETFQEGYLFEPQPTFSGYLIPLQPFQTEINLIVFNELHALITIPAVMSCTYDSLIKKYAELLGYRLTLLELVNDHHGTIFSPRTWRLNPPGSDFSWGGEMYGDTVEEKIFKLLRKACYGRSPLLFQ